MNNFNWIRRTRKVLLECVITSRKSELKGATSLRACVHLSCSLEHEGPDAYMYEYERISRVQRREVSTAGSCQQAIGRQLSLPATAFEQASLEQKMHLK